MVAIPCGFESHPGHTFLLMPHDFREDDRTIHDDQELRELLDRLHASQGLVDEVHAASPEEKVTVEDIAEALGMHPEDVARELARLHQEHREARLHGALKELEEPLYRVERPAVSGGDKLDPIFRLRSVQMLMDRNKETELLRRPVVKERESKASHWVGMLVVWLVVLAAVYLIGSAVWGALWR